MTKASVVFDLAFCSPKGRRGGDRPNGYRELKALLRYFQYRDDADGHIPQERGLERWVDRGLGQDWRSILNACQEFRSNRVLAWTLVISPAPDLMALMPPEQRVEVLQKISEQTVEAYYAQRGSEPVEYAYVVHDRLTDPQPDAPQRQMLHTHIVLPGTTPTLEGFRQPFYNRSTKGHIELLRQISTYYFEEELDQRVGLEWRRLRSEDVPAPAPDPNDLKAWFGPSASKMLSRDME